MNLQWICVAALLGIVGALPMQSHTNPEELMRIFQATEVGRNNAIETVIINAMEDLRQIMITGSDDIPVLDPLRVEGVDVDDSVIPIPGAHFSLRNMVVSNLSTFNLTEVSVEVTSIILQRYRAQIEGVIPRIDVDIGQYDLLVNAFGLNVFGYGDAKISITKPWLRVDTNVNMRLGTLALYLNIMSLRLDFGLDDIQFGINGMFDNPSVDNFVNLFLRNLVMEFAELWADEISDFISPIVQDVANEILRDINLIDILG